jgi:hypothetical protein
MEYRYFHGHGLFDAKLAIERGDFHPPTSRAGTKAQALERMAAVLCQNARTKGRAVQTGLSRRAANDGNQGRMNSLRRLADNFRRLLEEGITAKTNGQGSPNSTHRFNSRLSCG